MKVTGLALLPGIGQTRLATAHGGATPGPSPASAVRLANLRLRAPRLTRADKFARLAAKSGVGLALAVALFGGSAMFGAVRGGQYEAFVAANGSIADIAARNLGFALDSITITGSRDLYESEILQAAGVSEKNSLLFLDVADVRDRLKKVPLVREASVRKLYPDRLLIEITEREPNAVWQREGKLMAIAADGTVIEELRDDRFSELPFVVGAGAHLRVADFQKIVDAAGDVGAKVRAGVLVGERRWNIKMTNGLDVKLPERQPEAAFAQFARLAREARLLEKDLVSVDLRVPGRMFARMTEEAAAARAETQVRKKGRAGQT